MGYNSILGKIYSSHYASGKSSVSSVVTSSHWKKYGSMSSVIKEGSNFIMSGVGFGAFKPRTPFLCIKYLLPHLLSKSLLTEYNAAEIIKKSGSQVAKEQNRIMGFDCVKQILAADLLYKHDILNKAKVIAVIGDGYGFMTSLIKTICPDSSVICVNLGKILFYDVFYTGRAMPEEKCLLVDAKEDFDGFRKNAIFFVEAEKYDLLFSLSINLFINIASMQEMDNGVIAKYFSIMKSSTVTSYFYSCNRVSKELPDGTIIRFDDYPWSDEDKILVDELCPWYQRYPSARPPFWKFFDGPIKHKLVKLHK